jgi:pimeloyl-ACP methyl ester carboxylesterase
MTMDPLTPVDVPVTHHYAAVNGMRMHYVQAGSGGDVVVCLHGFPEFWWSWRHQLAALQGRATVIAPDLRGYGASGSPRHGYQPDGLVQDVVGLIDALGVDRVTLVGHDWGGVLAWWTAITHPWRVARLAVLAAPHPARFPPFGRVSWSQWRRSWYIGLFQLPWLAERALRASHWGAIERSLAPLRQAPGRFGPRDTERVVQEIARPGALSAALAYYRAAAQVGPRGMFRGTGLRVSAPTLVLWGAEDPYLGIELTRGLEPFVDDLSLEVIPGCSHWIQQDAPELVNARLTALLDGSLRSSAAPTRA